MQVLRIAHFATITQVRNLALALGYEIPIYGNWGVTNNWPIWLKRMLYVAMRQRGKRGRARQCWSWWSGSLRKRYVRGQRAETQREIQKAFQ